MGYYINPSDGRSKEQWLEEESNFSFKGTPKYSTLPPGQHFVCLVDNGWMMAAGIAFNEGEFNEFSRPDGRPKVWYQVNDEKLLKECPSVKLS